MAVPSQEQPTAVSSPTAQVVGNAFVHQYYHILHQSPELVYRFYQESSKLGRPESESLMSSITTMQAINEKILSLDYSDLRAEIKTVDAQESVNGGVVVLVTGYLTGKDNVRRNFTQTFFLAPQDKGFFVLNDMFRYMEDEYHVYDQGLANGMVVPYSPEQSSALEPLVSEQTASLTEEEVNVEEVYDPSDNEDGSVMEEEALVAEVVDEIQNDLQMEANPNSTVQEEVPKKSYASILQVKVMKENLALMPVPVPVPVPGPALASAKPAPANLERQVAPALAPDVVPSPTPAAPPVPETSSSLNTSENGNFQETEADGHSIYIKGLPLNATPAQLEEEFKRFGSIKIGGVQVRSNKQQGFCFGFVEFEVAMAVQSAIEASPLTIGGRQAYVEEKRASSSRVNNRGWFPAVRGGFRNVGGRGRGNYSNARTYSRGDFVNRGTNRGGSNRGGDGGYQKVDHMASNGGRMNRSGGFAVVNGVTKTLAPRVPAPA